MDEQKKPINQQASELEQRLKICEQSLSQEQFKLNLVNSIEKAVEKEKMIKGMTSIKHLNISLT